MPSIREAVAGAGDRAATGGAIPEGARDRREYSYHSLRVVAGWGLGMASIKSAWRGRITIEWRGHFDEISWARPFDGVWQDLHHHVYSTRPDQHEELVLIKISTVRL